MDNLARGEQGFGYKTEEKSGITNTRPPARNIVRMTRNIVLKFTGGGELVMDASAAFLSTLEACLLLTCHIRFVGCTSYDAFIVKSIQSLLFVFARQVLTTASHIEASDAIKKVCKVYVGTADDKM